ncbi:MAG TPA: VWA domain-containing protein [Gaiellaceae bacterium]|nr:VWA domain-containing protein [Gaiellaceae bacterium]
MGFGVPAALVLLALVPIAILVAVRLRRGPARYAVAFTNLEVLASVIEPRRSWRRLLPLAFFMVALVAAAVAVAQPQLPRSKSSPGATVVLLVDTSGSMRSTDVLPSRLGAAQEAIGVFLTELPPSYNVGLVAFDNWPSVIVRPTTNRALIDENLPWLQAGAGTAIGDGLAAAVRLIRSVDPQGKGGRRQPAAIVLLSDGSQTAGRLAPLSGARLARLAGIRVDTVALGTDHGVPNQSGVGGGSGPLSSVLGYGGLSRPMPPDVRMLAAIADEADGDSYRAGSVGRLDRIYARLAGTLLRRRQELAIGSWFAAAAALMLLASLGAGRAVAPRLG